MATKSTKSASTKKPRKAVARKVSSKKISNVVQHSRYQFVAGAVLVAALLLAMAGAFNSYQKSHAGSRSLNQTAMFIATDGKPLAQPGSTLSVKVYENSGSYPVNAVQSAVEYPSDKLEFVSVKTGADFPQEAATDNATPGLVRFARSVGTQSQSVTGPRLVATLQFKVLQSATDSVTFTFDKSSSLVVRSTDNKNLLQQTPPATFKIK